MVVGVSVNSKRPLFLQIWKQGKNLGADLIPESRTVFSPVWEKGVQQKSSKRDLKHSLCVRQKAGEKGPALHKIQMESNF